ncbi:NUDIX hydrolase [Oscillatoria sp. CS-180]|uniref:NUDIX hydrolase n=1 Tax=Oscillatoria sp. CS-180 TaxID=3021720 RepID=UPI0023300F9C|nr:NUDIX hydrolase [Oscillatoria sp. CS-180]MDB9524378.1 NUDIX hydrolase [Oscillatoria sp. CS-180]
MQREDVFDLILRHRPFDAQEAESCAAVKIFLEEHEHFWQRSNHVGHLTASAWLVTPEHSDALLTHHKKLNRWLQLGGHLEAEDADLLQGALREAREESGIQTIKAIANRIFDIDHHLINVPKEPSHVHYDIRFLLVAQDLNFSISEESHEVGWFALEDIPQIGGSTTLTRMARKTQIGWFADK